MFISRRKLLLIPSIQLLRNVTDNFSCCDYLLLNSLYSRSTSSDAVPANQPQSSFRKYLYRTQIFPKGWLPNTRLITKAHLRHTISVISTYYIRFLDVYSRLRITQCHYVCQICAQKSKPTGDVLMLELMHRISVPPVKTQKPVKSLNHISLYSGRHDVRVRFM